jgi:hypothetical protein
MQRGGSIAGEGFLSSDIQLRGRRANEGAGIMGKVIEINEVLWRRLSAVARRAKRTPEGLLQGLIQDFLETASDRTLDEAIARAAQSSGYREGDAVRLVREYRRQVRSKSEGKVGEPVRHYHEQPVGGSS